MNKQLINEVDSIRIQEFKSQYRNAFKQLNEQWISTNFKMESHDYLLLNNPEEEVIRKRKGIILIALEGEKPVGTCSLIEKDKDTCELIKMAVDPAFRGKRIGYKLGMAIIEKAKERGYHQIYLEGNTKLAPSISLYKKLGFKEVNACKIGVENEFQRCNILMSIVLD